MNAVATPAVGHIEALVRALLMSAAHGERASAYGAATIGEAALDEMLDAPLGQPRLWSRGGAEVPPQARLAPTPAGEQSRLAALSAAFHLSVFETDLLLVSLLPALDSRYERLYGFLQGDPERTGATVDLALTLLCAGAEERLRALGSLYGGLPVFRHGLLHLAPEPLAERAGLLNAALTVDTRIAGYLLGSDELDERLRPVGGLAAAEKTLAEMSLPPETANRLGALATSRALAGVFHFRGPAGFGKRSAAAALCRARGLSLLAVDAERLAAAPAAELDGILDAIFRESLLQPSAVYFDRMECMAQDGRESLLEAVLRLASDLPGACFFGGESGWEPPDGRFSRPVLRIDFRGVGAVERERLWSGHLNGASAAAAGLGARFRLSPSQIHNAVVTARNLAGARGEEVRTSDLFEACRMQSASRLGALARKIRTRATWDDIVLPSDRMEILREICNAVRHRMKVYEEWGFDRKLSLGKGLAVLFAGAPGTGKTLAAGILGAALGLDLYKIDLSVVVSKYIGETEKNLARIFAEAENTNAILFFDEADALFGRRSEVRDSHDRYANIEVGYLLQRMEEYEGMVILATNFRKNMDEAFVRRLQQTLEFPLPNADERARIWRGVWPPETPLSPECDFDALARGFEIAGGSIRNIALAAAFLAAEENCAVCPRHLQHALRREYQKMGKVVAGGFGVRAAEGSTVQP